MDEQRVTGKRRPKAASGRIYVRTPANGVWWARLWHGGAWHRWSSGSTDPKDAEAFLKKGFDMSALVPF